MKLTQRSTSIVDSANDMTAVITLLYMTHLIIFKKHDIYDPIRFCQNLPAPPAVSAGASSASASVGYSQKSYMGITARGLLCDAVSL